MTESSTLPDAAASPESGLVATGWEEPGTHCIFESRWWLDAVHDGEIDVLEVSSQEGLLGRMALPLSRKWGLVSARQPTLTQTLGPWVKTVSVNSWRQLAFEKEVMTELIGKMPKIDFHSLNFHHSRTNWLPFYWAGFSAGLRMTYVLDDIGDTERLWNQLDGNVRKNVKKARRTVQCEVSDDIDLFLSLHHKTFSRQGMTPFQSDDAVRRLDAACAARGCRRILLARDEAGRVHAGAYIVWDSRSAYYLIGGGDPELRNSGAGSLLMWEAITFASTVSRQFDFEGSMGEAIERFFRSFGGRQATFFNIRRSASIVRAAFLVKEGFSLLRGR